MHTHSQAATAVATPSWSRHTDPPSRLTRTLRALTLIFATAVALLGVQETVLAQTDPQWAVTMTDSNGNPASRIVEGGDPITITATITNGVTSADPLSLFVAWGSEFVSTAGGLLNGEDGSSALVVPPGASSAAFEISVVDDKLYAPNETRQIEVFTIPTGTAHPGRLTYVDNDEPPSLKISLHDPAKPDSYRERRQTIAEGDNFTLKGELSHGYTQQQIITVATVEDPTGHIVSGSLGSSGWRMTFDPGATRNTPEETPTSAADRDYGVVRIFNPILNRTLYKLLSTRPLKVTILNKNANPSAPRNVNVVPGNAQVELTWQWPESLTVITKYQYRQRAGSGSWGSFIDIPGSGQNTANHVVTGLTNGTEYRFQIRAMNGSRAGSGGPHQDYTPRVTPTAPRIEISDTPVTEGGHTEITITPAGAPFTGGKTVTLVIAKAGGIQNNFQPDDDFSVRDIAFTDGENAPTTRRSFTAPRNASSLTGRQAHYSSFMLPNFSNVIMRVTTEDDTIAECRERYFVFAYTDYGNAGQQRIAASGQRHQQLLHR